MLVAGEFNRVLRNKKHRHWIGFDGEVRLFQRFLVPALLVEDVSIPSMTHGVAGVFCNNNPEFLFGPIPIPVPLRPYKAARGVGITVVRIQVERPFDRGTRRGKSLGWGQDLLDFQAAVTMAFFNWAGHFSMGLGLRRGCWARTGLDDRVPLTIGAAQHFSTALLLLL
jgi:hypothetical protein